MVEVFKTDVRYKRQAKKVLDILSKEFPLFKINFDLEDCDKILRVEGEDIEQERIARLVARHGYQCITLE
jgi:hypothetical protein